MYKIVAATALSTLLGTSPLLAQTGENAPGVPSTAPDSSPKASGNVTDTQSPSATPASGLKEIVVTAQRRSENLQHAAVAVQAITGDAITNAGVSTPESLTSLVPALSASSAGGANEVFFVRGVGNFTVNGYTDPAIAFNYDGVYVGRPTSTAGVFYDLERVEVLKGPQGTLYGRNATAGAINVLPAKPKIGEFSGFLNGAFGNYATKNIQGAVNVPVGDDGAIRLAGTIADHDGYLSDGTGDENVRAVRLQALERITPDLTIRIAGDYAHTGGRGPGGNYAGAYAFNRTTNSYTFTPAPLNSSIGLLDPRAQAYRESIYAGLPGRRLGALDNNIYNDNEYHGANAELNWRTKLGTLTVIPAYRSAKLNDRFDSPGFIGWVQERQRQFSIETRFAGNRVSIFDYIVGGYFFDEHIRGNYTFSQDAFAVYQDFVTSTKSYAAFGRLTANLSDHLRVVGGVRYTSDHKDFDGVAHSVTIVCAVRVAGVPTCPNAPVLPVTDTIQQLPFPTLPVGALPIGATGALAVTGMPSVNQPLDSNRVTYRGAVEYDVAPRSLIYASIETGYRSGGFALAVGHETFQPEFITAYTIGSKNRFFDNRLQLNIEAFLWRYRDQQVNHVGIGLDGNQANFTDNVGKSVNKGVEAEAQYLLTPATLLSADVQYLDAKFRSFTYQQPVSSGAPYTTCAYQVDQTRATLYDINCAGKQAYQSPRWTINLGAQQTFLLGDYKLVAEADTQYRGSRYVGFEYAPFEHVGDTWTSNAQLTFSARNDRWSIAGFVRNIENRRIPGYAYEYGVGGIGVTIPSAPRTYGVRGSLKF